MTTAQPLRLHTSFPYAHSSAHPSPISSTRYSTPLSPNAIDIYEDLRAQNDMLRYRLGQKTEEGEFLKKHGERLRSEIKKLRDQVMALQFKHLRQDLLRCADQCRADKLESKLRAQLAEKEGRVAEMETEIERVNARFTEVETEAERLRLEVVGRNWVVEGLEAREVEREAAMRELKEECEKLRIDGEALKAERTLGVMVEEKFVSALRECQEENDRLRAVIRENEERMIEVEEDNERLRERCDALVEWAERSQEADEVVEGVFEGVLKTLEAWKKGQESENENEGDGDGDGWSLRSREETEAGIEIVVSDREGEQNDERSGWDRSATMDKWVSGPSLRAPGSVASCNIPLPESPSELGVDRSPIVTTPTSSLLTEDLPQRKSTREFGPTLEASAHPCEQGYVTRESSESSSERSIIQGRDGDYDDLTRQELEYPMSPTLLGSGSEAEMGTESEEEESVVGYFEDDSTRKLEGGVESEAESIMLGRNIFREADYTLLTEERLSPIVIPSYLESSGDETLNARRRAVPLTRSPGSLRSSGTRLRSESLSSLRSLNNLATFKVEQTGRTAMFKTIKSKSKYRVRFDTASEMAKRWYEGP